MEPSSLPIEYQQQKKLLLRESTAQETRRALKKHWLLYQKWCKKHQVPDFPCQLAVMEAYLIELYERKNTYATIEQARWALDSWNKMNNLPAFGQTEQIKKIVKGIRRTLGSKQCQKEAFTLDHLKKIAFPPTLPGLRDKILLVFGFYGGFRRSELTSLVFENITLLKGGMRVELNRSKTNQEGKNEFVDLVQGQDPNFCPKQLLQRWKEEANIQTGYIFRSFYKGGRLSERKISDNQVGILLKFYARQLGLDAASFSGHSLRAGLATYLLDKSLPLAFVAKQLRHKRIDTTLKYDRNTSLAKMQGLF